MSTPVSQHPTEQSIASARADQLRERAKFTADTGIELSDDGKMLGLLMAKCIIAAAHGLYRDRN